jgi:hypothetical protein
MEWRENRNGELPEDSRHAIFDWETPQCFVCLNGVPDCTCPDRELWEEQALQEDKFIHNVNKGLNSLLAE